MRMLTIEEVAEALRLTRQWVYVMARRGDLPCVRLGRRVRVPEAALADWVLGRIGVASRGGEVPPATRHIPAPRRRRRG